MMAASPAIPDLELRPSLKLWTLGALAVGFGLLTATGEVPAITVLWIALGGYYLLRAHRGRLFVSERVLWQRGAFRDRRVLALDELDDVVTYQTWPLKKTLILMDESGGRHVVRLVEWRDIRPLLTLIRSLIETGDRRLDDMAAHWFDQRTAA